MTLRRAVLLAALAGAIGACQSTPPRQYTRRLPAKDFSPDQNVTADQAVITDPSASQLEDIEEAILFYYRVNQSMPPTLDALRSLGTFGAQLNFISPSGQPYAYFPNGLSMSGSQKFLIACDPAETASGKRWCILISPPRPGAALSAEVIALPEIVFRTYLASEQ
jgi:hypothetical protein